MSITNFGKVSEKIRAIIVDDEIGACENLKAILTQYCPYITVLECAQTTAEAESHILNYKPDLVFLDIEMPNESGIEFIRRIWPINFEIVFVTAYDQYAIKTFRLKALDYILKPINIDYLKESALRISETILSKKNVSISSSNAPARLISYTQEGKEDHIILRHNSIYEIIPFENIIYLQADGSYSSFVINDNNLQKKIITTYNLAYYEEILPKEFIRCHRSFLVNMNKAASLNLVPDEKKIVLTTDEEIPISRRRLAAIKKHLK